MKDFNGFALLCTYYGYLRIHFAMSINVNVNVNLSALRLNYVINEKNDKSLQHFFPYNVIIM